MSTHSMGRCVRRVNVKDVISPFPYVTYHMSWDVDQQCIVMLCIYIVYLLCV